MKTSNTFIITDESVTVKIFDVTPVNGEKPEKPVLLKEKVFDLKEVPEKLEAGDGFKSLKAYGFSRLMQDRASQLNDTPQLREGMAHTVQELADNRMEYFEGVYELVKGGKFEARREGAGKQAAIDPYFASGFAAYLCENGKDVTIEVATAILQGLDKEKRAALRKHEDVAGHIAEAKRRANEAAADIDLGSLFG